MQAVYVLGDNGFKFAFLFHFSKPFMALVRFCIKHVSQRFFPEKFVEYVGMCFKECIAQYVFRRIIVVFLAVDSI